MLRLRRPVKFNVTAHLSSLKGTKSRARHETSKADFRLSKAGAVGMLCTANLALGPEEKSDTSSERLVTRV